MFIIFALALFLCITDVSAHGALVSLNSQPYAGTGEGLYGARNWRTHKLHQGQLVRYYKRRFEYAFKKLKKTHTHSVNGIRTL